MTILALLLCVLCIGVAARAGPIAGGSGVLLTDLLAGGSYILVPEPTPAAMLAAGPLGLGSPPRRAR